MRTLGHLLTGVVVFPVTWAALALLIVAESLVRWAVRLSRIWR